MAQAGPTALQSASAPRGTRGGHPLWLRPFEPGSPWLPPGCAELAGGPAAGAECGWRVGLKGSGGRREGTEGRRQEPGVKPGSLAVYPNDFLFRPETPMRQDQTALQAVRVGRRECVCVPFARRAL